MEFIKLDDGTEIALDFLDSRYDCHATLFIACPEEPGSYVSACTFSKKDARKIRDSLDEWLNEEEDEE